MNQVDSIDIVSCGVVDLGLPLLEEAGWVEFDRLPFLRYVELSSLSTLYSDFVLRGLAALEMLNVSRLVSVGGDILFTAVKLAEVAFDSLADVGDFSLVDSSAWHVTLPLLSEVANIDILNSSDLINLNLPRLSLVAGTLYFTALYFTTLYIPTLYNLPRLSLVAEEISLEGLVALQATYKVVTYKAK